MGYLEVNDGVGTTYFNNLEFSNFPRENVKALRKFLRERGEVIHPMSGKEGNETYNIQDTVFTLGVNNSELGEVNVLLNYSPELEWKTQERIMDILSSGNPAGQSSRKPIGAGMPL